MPPKKPRDPEKFVGDTSEVKLNADPDEPVGFVNPFKKKPRSLDPDDPNPSDKQSS